MHRHLTAFMQQTTAQVLGSQRLSSGELTNQDRQGILDCARILHVGRMNEATIDFVTENVPICRYGWVLLP